MSMSKYASKADYDAAHGGGDKKSEERFYIIQHQGDGGWYAQQPDGWILATVHDAGDYFNCTTDGSPLGTKAKEAIIAELQKKKGATPSHVATTDHECWLIERFVNDRTEFWAGWNDDAYGLGAGPSSKWTHDAFEAVRFSRKEDADAVMFGQGGRFHLAKTVAHLWINQ